MRRVLIGAALIVLAATGVALLLMLSAARRPLDAYERSTRRALQQAGFERRTTPGPDGPLIWWEAGAGADLVFLHGAGDQAGAWAHVAPAFTDAHRVLVVDLPGHGDSAPHGPPLSLSRVVDGAARLLRARERSGPATLVGSSLGAWVAMLYAERYPDDVARIVAVNGGALRNAPAPDLALPPTDRAQARRLVAALRDPESDPLPDAVLDDLARRGRDGPIAWLAADAADAERQRMDDRLATFATPVDVVWGVADRWMPLGYAEAMVARLPRARLTRIERCGHLPAHECPERLVASLRTVLAAAPPRTASEEQAAADCSGDERAVVMP